MFINFVDGVWFADGTITYPQAADKVLTNYTAEQHAYYIERLWQQPRLGGRNLLPGGTDAELINHAAWSVDLHPAPLLAPQPLPAAYWRHIVYAYMLEATNLEALFRRIVQEWVVGERLPFPTTLTSAWLRTTEQLFFTNPQPPSIRALTSDIRSDRNAVRRNAYYRLLGMELPATLDGRATAFLKPDTSNREFLRAWEALLRETWAAFMNRTNFIGPNSADPTSLLELVRELHQMLLARRINGALSREEYDSVVHFSWFHATVAWNTAIVANLNANSTSAALRLKKMADLVGVPIHSKTDSFIVMADAMADVLEWIEGPNAPVNQLYLGAGAVATSMRLMWTHWTLATGRPIKGLDVRPFGSPQTLPQSQQVAIGGPGSAVMPQTSRFQPAML